MGTRSSGSVVLAVVLVSIARIAAAEPIDQAAIHPTGAGGGSSLLSPPAVDVGPLVVRVHFDLRDVNEINDGLETFEVSGKLTLQWRDPRQAFDPNAFGDDEKVFQGSYQFNEVSTGWYPQLVLVNEAGSYQKDGVVLRIRPDGTSTLIETLTAVAETELEMVRFPFDAHRLELVFEVLGFDRDEVRLEVDSNAASPTIPGVRIPQWTVTGYGVSIRDRPVFQVEGQIVASSLVVTIDVDRKPLYMARLIILPLFVIVLLSFSVFWMDRSSLGDRISVSFVGILTGVAYQMVIGDSLPRISYITLMHGFLTFSFLTMCATVVINLVVGNLDKRGMHAKGDAIDRRCRWIFPLVYFGTTFGMVGLAFALS